VNTDGVGPTDEPILSVSHDSSVPHDGAVYWFAPHATATHRVRAERLIHLLDECAILRYVSHHTHGVLDFEIARGPVEEVPERPPQALDPLERVSPYRRVAQLIGYTVEDLDQQVQEARTGNLIRLVIHCSRLAVFCEQVVPGELVVAVARLSSEPAETALSKIPQVRNADRAVSDLVEGLRELLSQEPQNLGGWLTSQSTDPDPGRPRDQLTGPGLITCHGQDRRAADLLADVLDLNGPHFLALYSGQRLRARVDLLDDADLEVFALHLSGSARRRVWTDLGARLNAVLRQLAEALGGSDSGTLRRLVLDVERGAVYLYPIDDETYLVGATLKQRRVSQTDDALAEFVRRAAGRLRTTGEESEE
jgi:hypothetical protein